MTPASDDRVLAIMLKAPRPGHVKTRLLRTYPADRVVALYRALVDDTVALAHSLGVATAAICPSGDEGELAELLPDDMAVIPQRGRGLAAALSFTFERLCGPEGRRVIAFNGDSPHLAPRALEGAFVALSSHDLVIGPCDDGGYYLVGATREHPGLFQADAVGTRSAFEALRGAAESRGLRLAFTPEHYDVDAPADLLRLAHELVDHPERAPRTAAALEGWPAPTDGVGS